MAEKYNPLREITPVVARNPEEDPEDLCSRLGAQRCAERIMTYWHTRGYRSVSAWVAGKASVDRGGKSIYSVETNLIAGVPIEIFEKANKANA